MSYLDFCEQVGIDPSDPDDFDRWLGQEGQHQTTRAHQAYNEDLKDFFEQQEDRFKDTFVLFCDEDGKAAIAHKQLSFLRVHQSKKEKGFYIRVRLSLVSNSYREAITSLVHKNRITPPKKSYQKDHTLYDRQGHPVVLEIKELLVQVDSIVNYLESSAQNDATTTWYYSEELLPDEVVIDEHRSQGGSLKAPADIKETNFGRVFFKGRLVRPSTDSKGTLGVWFPCVGWRTKKGGLSYRQRFQLASPNKESLRITKNQDVYFDPLSDFFMELKDRWEKQIN